MAHHLAKNPGPHASGGTARAFGDSPEERRMAHPWTGAGSGSSHHGPGICHPRWPRTPADHRPFSRDLGPRSPRTGVSSTRTNTVFRLMTISSSTDIGHRVLDFGHPVHQHRWFEDWGVLLDQWSRARANNSQGSTPLTCPRDPDPWILGRVVEAGHADLLRRWPRLQRSWTQPP